ncbi:MAG: hypothetical protein JST37_09545 [Bacteroidetes bacterium]|nr:hypothetical protein [Bacteroidota bacterium]
MDTFNLIVGIVGLISGFITIHQALKRWPSLGKLIKVGLLSAYDLLLALEKRPPVRALLILGPWLIRYGSMTLGVLMAMLGAAGRLPIEMSLLAFLFMFLLGESGFVLFKYESKA